MSNLRSDNLDIREAYRTCDRWGKVALALSTWFGTGLVKVAPGTCGTLTAVPLALAVGVLGTWYGAIVLLMVVVIAIPSSNRARMLTGREDPPEVVIDEVAGFLLTMFLLPASWLSYALGFALFRVFDIAKPFPVKQLERLGNGFGIVLDDLLAGVYANLGVRLILHVVD
jgi:phosphatidylglycerophosphatase A